MSDMQKQELGSSEDPQAIIDSLKQQLASLTLTWTRETPTVAGWYWWREQPAHGRQGVHHIDLDVTEPYCTTGDDESLEEMGGEWAGPILMPKE